jgi:hypothetical protein
VRERSLTLVESEFIKWEWWPVPPLILWDSFLSCVYSVLRVLHVPLFPLLFRGLIHRFETVLIRSFLRWFDL